MKWENYILLLYKKEEKMSTFYSVLSGVYLLSFDRYIDLTIPLWAFWVMLICWIAIIPATAILCSIVMYISMLYLKMKDCFKILRKTIIQITCFSFLCDLIVVVFLLLLETGEDFIDLDLDSYHWYKNVFLRALERNPFSNVFALAVLCSIILLLRILNYQLNKRITFLNIDIEEEKKKKLALAIAIFTAPYIFFIPIG